MHGKKVQAILFCYDSLLSGKALEKEMVKLAFSISESSFIRYIAEIRAFLAENHSELELCFIRSEGSYQLRPVIIKLN